MKAFVRSLKRLTVFLAAVLFLPLLAHAQSARVSGTVTDSSGGVVSHAKVTFTNTATNSVRTTESSDAGYYSVPDLAPGLYNITVEKSGFKSVTFTGVQLTVEQQMGLDAKLDVSTVTESITVTGATVAPVDTSDAQLSNVVEEQQIKALPLITRDPDQLILLGPGVIQSNSGLGGFSVNGGRERNNNFLLDGVDNNDTSVPGIPSGLNALNPDSTQEFRVISNNFAPEYGRNNGAIIDAITKGGSNDFHGDVYYFGRFNGFGGARDFFNPPGAQNPYIRNDFGASVGGPIKKDKTFWFANYEGQRFDTTLTNTAVVPTAAFKTGIFTFDPKNGGPLENVNVSTAGSANNRTGLAPDPLVAKILALYPSPNGGAVDTFRGLLFFGSKSLTANNDFTVKVDHRISNGNTLSVRYAYNHSTDPNPFHTDVLPGNIQGIGTFQQTQNAGATLTSIISPSVVNELRAGANRTNLQFICDAQGIVNSFGALDAFGRGADFGFPGISGFGCQALGDTNAQARFTGTYSYFDNLSVNHGSHSFKFGAETRFVYANSFNSFASRPALNFSVFSNNGVATVKGISPGKNFGDFIELQNLVGALQGLVDSQAQTQFFTGVGGVRQSNDLRGWRQREFAVFAQDSYKFKPNLTVTYGLRWEYYGVPFDVNNLLSNLFTDASGAAPFTFSVVGHKTGGQLYNNDLRNFEPRVGIAWDPFKTGKTSVRAAYGIFHDRVFDNLFGNSRGNPPFEPSFFAQPFVQVSKLAAPPVLTPSSTVQNGAGIFPIIFDPNFRTPYSQNWNFGIEREQWGTVFEADYVGVKGNRIFRVVDGAPPQPGLVAALRKFCVPGNPANTGFSTASGQCSASTIQFTNLFFGQEFGVLPFDAVNNNAFFDAALNKSIGNSNYQGLQTKVTKRMSHGLQIQGAYTYSHTIDDSSDALVPTAGNGNFPVNSFNLRAERGNSGFDVRHRGVVNFIYDPNIGRGRGHFSGGLLGRALEGWELAGIISAQTGEPYDIFGNVDSQGTNIPDRAQLIGNPANTGHVDETHTGPALSAFGQTPLGSASNLGRNTFYAPGLQTWNVDLSKTSTITERMRLEMRFEFYNLFNHTNFAPPGNNIGNTGTFGVSTSTILNPDSTTSARQLQVAAKFIF
ncbi:MAG: TonB-dependent receptor domain-containing protein [Candidatus Acidiferrales bacterium]